TPARRDRLDRRAWAGEARRDTVADQETGAPAGSRLTDDELQEFLAGAWICRMGTLTEDGAPCVTPVWYDYDGAGYVIIGRERAECLDHIRHDPPASVCIDDPDGRHRLARALGRAET